MKHAQPMPSLMLRTKLAQQTQPPRDFIGALREAVCVHFVWWCSAVLVVVCWHGAASCCMTIVSCCAGEAHESARSHCRGEEGISQPRRHPGRL
jgi:hypothetical protein